VAAAAGERLRGVLREVGGLHRPELAERLDRLVLLASEQEQRLMSHLAV